MSARVMACVVCDGRYLDGERGSRPVTCPACVALRKGVVTDEARELRLLHELYARVEGRPAA